MRDGAAVGLLWASVIACFWRIALSGRVLAGGDVFTYFYPYWAEATRAVQSGRLPLWNPYLFMGAPFLANSQVGLLYPLNWPLWLLLPAHRSVHLTIVLHLCLAALNAYVWGRASLRLGRVGAWTVGAAFALGGHLGAQVEHVNQLQGLAWLPLLLTLWDRPAGRRTTAGMAAVVALMLLAGHAQTAFIALAGLTVYGLWLAVWEGFIRRNWGPALRGTLRLCIVGGWGAALAAAQLLPTWELTRLSVRAGGLPFNERVSFSLAPRYLLRALLPSFSGPVPPDQLEFVAYVGVVGLLLAAVGARAINRPLPTAINRPLPTAPASHFPLPTPYSLLLPGLFLAFGLYNPLYLLLARFAPGFAHFRAPARWLALYALGMAALAGRGADTLAKRWGWARAAAASLLLVGELYVAGLSLPHARATAPQAFTSLRPAIAHLLAAQERERPAPAGRFISMSDITFDPGDLPEIKAIYGPQLPAAALYDYIIAAKHKEVLSPALPLAFGVPSVDGYDGGVLPLARYVLLERLLLPGGEVSMDGRLRENLRALPDDRWLDLFNVRHIITDKLRDAWLDGVFYDLQFGARLAPGETAAVAHVPPFEATALGMVAYVDGDAPPGALCGVVELGFGGGVTRTFELRAGEHVTRSEAATRLRWTPPAAPTAVIVRGASPAGELVVRGVSLIDERTGGFQSLVLSEGGGFRLAHSGDVKVYENLDALPRAFLVYEAVSVEDDEAALGVMESPTFDPARRVVLAENSEQGVHAPPLDPQPVEILSYAPERVEIALSAAAPGYLVLTDAWYPGWQAMVDDVAAPILRADVLFRAVAVDAGAHRVVLTFRPLSLRVGAGVSLAACLAMVVIGDWGLGIGYRKRLTIAAEHAENAEVSVFSLRPQRPRPQDTPT